MAPSVDGWRDHLPKVVKLENFSLAAGYPLAESGSNKPKGGGGLGKSGDGGKVTSGSADDYGSQRLLMDLDAARKRSFSDAFIGGESSKPVTAAQNKGTNAEAPYTVRQRTVSKLPVSALRRATLPGPATNLNIGMEIWCAPHVETAPNVRPNSANVASAPVGANGAVTDHPWIQDERDLKRE